MKYPDVKHSLIAPLLAISALTFITACSVDMPLTAQLADGSETFKGALESGMSTTAPFSMTSSKGTTCSGTFTMKTARTGTGAFTCLDGRQGSLEYTMQPARMVGAGTLAGKPITLTIVMP